LNGGRNGETFIDVNSGDIYETRSEELNEEVR
jgi:hypothetical protein